MTDDCGKSEHEYTVILCELESTSRACLYYQDNNKQSEKASYGKIQTVIRTPASARTGNSGTPYTIPSSMRPTSFALCIDTVILSLVQVAFIRPLLYDPRVLTWQERRGGQGRRKSKRRSNYSSRRVVKDEAVTNKERIWACPRPERCILSGLERDLGVQH